MLRCKRFMGHLLILAIVLAMIGCTVQKPQIQSTVPSGSLGATDPTTNPTESQGIVPPTTEPVTQPTAVPPATDSVAEPSSDPPETEPVTQLPTTPPDTEKPTEPPVTQPSATEPPYTQPATTPPTTKPEYQGGIPTQVTVEASGVLVKSSEKVVIDYSNTKDGYVMVCYQVPSDKKLKAQVQGPSTTYTYNLTPEKWAAFPLSDENGDYKITVFQNTTGSKYATVLSVTISVQMTDEFAPFLRSNQYVDFDAAPNAVAKAAVLTAGITDPLKKVEKVYDFVVGSLTYDTELAATVKSGYLPELDTVLEKRKGICFDYAALMTGMLRSQGVPTKLVVGYAGTVYHAWISVWSETDGWVDGVIWFDGDSWQRMDPTFASSGGNNPNIMDYIGNGSNYTPKYFY